MKRIVLTLLIIFCCGTAFAGSFTDNNNGTITDNVTGLTWQKCTNGWSGNDCSTPPASGDGLYNWYEATGTNSTNNPSRTNVCGSLNLNGTGWRLPNIKELTSLVDTTSAKAPLIDSHFPNTQSDPYHFYWSSTTYSFAPNFARFATFNGGETSFQTKTTYAYVRCVR